MLYSFGNVANALLVWQCSNFLLLWQCSNFLLLQQCSKCFTRLAMQQMLYSFGNVAIFYSSGNVANALLVWQCSNFLLLWQCSICYGNVAIFMQTIIQRNNHLSRAGALVYWLWEETRVPKVVSSNPGTISQMDFFHIGICCKFCNVFEKTKINEKEAVVGPFSKKNNHLSS